MNFQKIALEEKPQFSSLTFGELIPKAQSLIEKVSENEILKTRDRSELLSTTIGTKRTFYTRVRDGVKAENFARLLDEHDVPYVRFTQKDIKDIKNPGELETLFKSTSDTLQEHELGDLPEDIAAFRNMGKNEEGQPCYPVYAISRITRNKNGEYFYVFPPKSTHSKNANEWIRKHNNMFEEIKGAMNPESKAVKGTGWHMEVAEFLNGFRREEIRGNNITYLTNKGTVECPCAHVPGVNIAINKNPSKIKEEVKQNLRNTWRIMKEYFPKEWEENLDYHKRYNNTLDAYNEVLDLIERIEAGE